MKLYKYFCLLNTDFNRTHVHILLLKRRLENTSEKKKSDFTFMNKNIHKVVKNSRYYATAAAAASRTKVFTILLRFSNSRFSDLHLLTACYFRRQCKAKSNGLVRLCDKSFIITLAQNRRIIMPRRTGNSFFFLEMCLL